MSNTPVTETKYYEGGYEIKADTITLSITEYEQIKQNAERYECLGIMATKDYEVSVGYQFVGKLDEFVDAIKPSVDQAIAKDKP